MLAPPRGRGYIAGSPAQRSLRLSVRTSGFQPEKRGSTPLGTASAGKPLENNCLRPHRGNVFYGIFYAYLLDFLTAEKASQRTRIRHRFARFESGFDLALIEHLHDPKNRFCLIRA